MIKNTAISQSNHISFFKVMFEAIAHPSTGNYRNLARNSEASVGKAYLWVAITALVSSIISALVGSYFPENTSLNYLYAVGDWLGRILGSALRTTGIGGTTTALLLGVLQVVIFAVISFAITSGSLHLVARLLGGKGDYSKLAFLLAAISAPFTIYSGLALSLSFLNCVELVLGLYAIVLHVLVIYVVYQFSLGKAVGTWLMGSTMMILLILKLEIGLAALGFPLPR